MERRAADSCSQYNNSAFGNHGCGQIDSANKRGAGSGAMAPWSAQECRGKADVGEKVTGEAMLASNACSCASIKAVLPMCTRVRSDAQVKAAAARDTT